MKALFSARQCRTASSHGTLSRLDAHLRLVFRLVECRGLIPLSIALLRLSSFGVLSNSCPYRDEIAKVNLYDGTRLNLLGSFLLLAKLRCSPRTSGLHYQDSTADRILSSYARCEDLGSLQDQIRKDIWQLYSRTSNCIELSVCEY